MSDNTRIHKTLTYQEKLRNEYLIDGACADAHLPQSARQGPTEFANQEDIALQDYEHASAFLLYFKKHEKVDSLIRKAAKKFGYEEADIKKAIEIVRKRFKMPEDITAARMLLANAKDEIAREILGLPTEPSSTGTTESSGMFSTGHMPSAEVQRLIAKSRKTDQTQAPVLAGDASPQAEAEGSVPEAKAPELPKEEVAPAPKPAPKPDARPATPAPLISGDSLIPRNATMAQLAAELDGPIPPQKSQDPDADHAEVFSIGELKGKEKPPERKEAPAPAPEPKVILSRSITEETKEKPYEFIKPKNKHEKRAYRLLKYVAKRNDFSEAELHNAMDLCRKYNWLPRAPRIALRKKTRERREELRSQALDLLNQARKSYDYIEDIGHSAVSEGELGRRAMKNVKARHSHFGQRIISDDVRTQLMAEYEFLSSPSRYLSSYGSNKNYPIRAIMEVKERLSGKIIPGSKWELTGKHPFDTPDMYCKKLLDLAMEGIRGQLSGLPRRSPLADRADKANNFNMINLALREEHQRRKDGKTYSVEVQKLAQNSSEARGRVFSGSHEAHAYLQRAQTYADAAKSTLAFMKEAAKKFGFDKDEVSAAAKLSSDHLIVPADIHEASDMLLQARLASQGKLSDYIWGIAQEGLYPYSVAFQLERRYIADATPLTRDQALALLEDEKKFQEDPYKFAASIVKTVSMENNFGFAGKTPSQNDPLVVALGYTLSQFLNGKADPRISPFLLAFHRRKQAHELLSPQFKALLDSKLEEFTISQTVVKKAAEEYSKLVSNDMDAGKAVIEALRRIHDDGESAKTLTEAIALFKDTLWQVKNKSALQSRVKRNLITQDIADAAWARILPQRREFGSMDEEMSFYADIFEERGLPYPAKLLAYLNYHAGNISREAAEAVIARLDMEEPGFSNEEEALMFIASVEGEIQPKKAPAPKEKARVPQKVIYSPTPGKKVDVHKSTEYARTVIGGNGGAVMFKFAELPLQESFLPGALDSMPGEPAKPAEAPAAQAPASEEATTTVLRAAEAPAPKPAASEPARTEGAKPEVSVSETRAPRVSTLPQPIPVLVLGKPIREGKLPQDDSKPAEGKPEAPQTAHPASLQMAQDARGGTAPKPIVLPAPMGLPKSLIATPTPDDAGGVLGPGGKIRPPDEWGTTQRPAPTEAEIAAAEKAAAAAPAPMAAVMPSPDQWKTTQRPAPTAAQIAEELAAKKAPEEPKPEEKKPEAPAQTEEEIARALAEKAALIKAGGAPAPSPATFPAPDEWGTVQRPAPTEAEIAAAEKAAAAKAPEPAKEAEPAPIRESITPLELPEEELNRIFHGSEPETTKARELMAQQRQRMSAFMGDFPKAFMVTETKEIGGKKVRVGSPMRLREYREDLAIPVYITGEDGKTTLLIAYRSHSQDTWRRYAGFDGHYCKGLDEHRQNFDWRIEEMLIRAAELPHFDLMLGGYPLSLQDMGIDGTASEDAYVANRLVRGSELILQTAMEKDGSPEQFDLNEPGNKPAKIVGYQFAGDPSGTYGRYIVVRVESEDKRHMYSVAVTEEGMFIRYIQNIQGEGISQAGHPEIPVRLPADQMWVLTPLIEYTDQTDHVKEAELSEVAEVGTNRIGAHRALLFGMHESSRSPVFELYNGLQEVSYLLLSEDTKAAEARLLDIIQGRAPLTSPDIGPYHVNGPHKERIRSMARKLQREYGNYCDGKTETDSDAGRKRLLKVGLTQRDIALFGRLKGRTYEEVKERLHQRAIQHIRHRIAVERLASVPVAPAPAPIPEPLTAQAVSPEQSDVEAAIDRLSMLPGDGRTIPSPPPKDIIDWESAQQPAPVPEPAVAVEPAPQKPQDPDADHAEVFGIGKLEVGALQAAPAEAAAPAPAPQPAPAEEQVAPDAPAPSSPTQLMSPAQQDALTEESRARDSQREELRAMHFARRLYHSTDPAKRMEAVEELSRMGTPAALYALAGALGQGGDVSPLAASVLLSYRDDALFALASVLEEGSDGGKTRAVSILVQIGTKGAYETLARALLDDEYGISGEAAFHLLLAEGTRTAETRKHFYSIPEEKSLYLLESMLSGIHPASELESVVLRAESAVVLAGLLEAKPWAASSIKPGTWMAAIDEWSKAGTEKSYAAMARAFSSADDNVCAEAAFQLLVADAAGKADNSARFTALKDEKALQLLRKTLLGMSNKPEAECAEARLKAATLLDSFAKAGRSASQVYPILASVLGDDDQKVAKFAFDSLQSAGFAAIPHMEIQLFTGSDAAVEKAAQLFLLVKGTNDEKYYAYSRLLSAGFENKHVMGLLENCGSFDIFCTVLNDNTADARARKSAAMLINREDAATALPLLMDACLGTTKIDDNDHKEIRETILSLLKSRPKEPETELPILLDHYSLHKEMQPHLQPLLKARPREPEAEVPILLRYYKQHPSLQPLVSDLLGGCDAEKAIPVALRENRLEAREPSYDLAIKQLVQEAYGLGCIQHIADYAKAEYPKILAQGTPASRKAAAEEARFLISIFPSEFSREHSLRFLEAALPLLPHMGDVQKSAVCNFARRMKSEALPLILQHAKDEVKAGRPLGNETTRMLLPVVDHIGERKGIEFFGRVLPEAAAMDAELLGSLGEFGSKLDPVRAESMILDHVNEMASSSKLSKAGIMAMIALEGKIAPKALEASGSKYHRGAELLSYALPMLNSMDQDGKHAVGGFAMNLKASALPFVLGYAESETRAGRRLGAENAFLLSAVVDYIGERDGIEFLGYILPEIAGMDSQKMKSIKVLVDLDQERAEKLVLDHAKMRHSAGQLSKEEMLSLLEIAAEIARLAALSENKSSCAEFFRYVTPWLSELNGEQFEMVASVLKLDAALAERELLDYANAKASDSGISKDELFSLMAMEHELANMVAASKGSSDGASLLVIALPMLREMDEGEATKLAYFASSSKMFGARATVYAEAYMESRGTLTKHESAALALMLARINTEASFALLTRIFEEETRPEVYGAMEGNLKQHYFSDSEGGEKPVRETLLRAALGRKVSGKEVRDQKEKFSTLGVSAFEIIASCKDASRDVILGCRDAHFCVGEDAESSSRLLQARELLVKIGDSAITDLSEVVFSPDLSRYPVFYKANLLSTIASMAERSEKLETKEMARQCMFQAVRDFELDESAVGGALRMMKIEVVKDLALLLLPDPSGSTKLMEDRACGILAAMGPVVHEQIGRMLATGDATQEACGALAVEKLLSRESNPANALKKSPQLQANLDSLVGLLVYPDENVRETSAQALRKFWAFVSLEEAIKATSKVISSEDEYSRAQGAILVSSIIAREANPAEVLQKYPQLQACVDALPGMLVDSSKVVRDTAEDAFKRIGKYVSLPEFEKAIRLRKDEPRMLLFQDEVSQRRKAAALLAMAGEPAIDHFLSIIRDGSLDGETKKRCIEASVSIGERMLEKLVEETAHRSVEDKFYLLKKAAGSKTPVGVLLTALLNHSAVWHNLLGPAGITQDAHIPAWESKLLQWFVVRGTVRKKDEFVADVAFSFMSSLKLFSAADLAADFRETLDAKIEVDGDFGAKTVEGDEDEARIALSNVGMLEKKGIDTTPIKDAIVRKPGPISEERAKYEGFLKEERKQSKAKPPPPPKRPNNPNGGPGGRL